MLLIVSVLYVCVSLYCLCLCVFFFFFKQKTAYEMRISDWSSDVCSSDLLDRRGEQGAHDAGRDERHDDGDGQGPDLHCAADRCNSEGTEPLAVEPEHREDGTDLDGDHVGAECLAVRDVPQAEHPSGHEDRKSVVSGTRVYVRLVPVGRRLNKHKKT